MIPFLLKTALLMVLLLAVYQLFLGREKMHRFSRYYLLAALLFSLVTPFISFETEQMVIPTLSTVVVDQPLMQENDGIGVHAAEAATVVEQPKDLDWQMLLLVIYFAVSATFLVRFALNLSSIIRRARMGERQPLAGATLVLMDEPTSPFSFLRFIFVSGKDYQQGAIGPEMLTHELTHVRQRHTIDVLLIELLQVVLWFNPLVYLYKRAIRTNHEYLADEHVIDHHQNVNYYQHLLLDTIFRKNTPSLVSSINFSLTKKRLIMMTKKTSKSKKSAIGVLLIALIVPLLCTFCAQSDDFNLEKELDNIGMASDFMSNEGDLYYLHGNLSVYDYRDKGKDSIAKTPFSKLSKEMLARVADKCEIVFKVQPVVAADLQRWQEKAAYGIWINNNYSENNAILKSYQPADLVLFEVEKVDGYQKDTLNGGRSQMVKLLTKENYLNFERRFKRQQNILRSGDVHKLDRLYVLF